LDKLTDEERILAWKSTWHPSFSGIAIINRDFTFRSVNPQFCKLLGVTPAELIGTKFQDITPQGVREVDEKNAKLVIDGSIDFYLLPKRYQFSSHSVDVVLLVTRAPLSIEGDFQFFVSRIMLDEKGELLTSHTGKLSPSEPFSPSQTETVKDIFTKYGAWATAIGTLLGALITALVKSLSEN
jgi:PAS domain S-box-containing protein